RFDAADAKRFAQAAWGLAVESARELPSERDQNFDLETPRGRVVLKIGGPDEKAENVNLQNRALEWIAARDPEIPVPRLLPDLDGRLVAAAEGRAARLLTPLPGTALAAARPRSAALLRGLGRELGRLDRALEGFAHPAARGRDLLWNPDRALDVIARHVSAIDDPARRGIVEHFVAQHARVAPLLPALPRSVIHND